MDFEPIGETALRRLREVSADAVSVQKRLLSDLLRRNSQTEYGRKYGFSRISSVEEYQEAVPVSEYRDYEALIQRQTEGGEQLITADETVFYCISSGSTDVPKYIPITKADILIQKTYLMDAVMGSIRREQAGVPENELFGKIFMLCDFFRTFMPDGTMNGVRSGVLHRWLESKEELDVKWYTAPKEVLFSDNPEEDMLYVKLRFALAERHVTAIHGVFVNRVVAMIRYLLVYWEQLLEDIAAGDVNECFQVSEPWKKFLRERLPADPVRAGELAAIPEPDREKGIVLKIWPDIKYVRLVGGSIFRPFMEELRGYIGKLPVHYFAYAASESCLGVAYGMNQEEAYYILIPEACFFEFIPEGQSGGRPLIMGELQAGQKYELLITTLSGFYRYALGDVVEVAGFSGQAPVIRFCYRKNQVLNIADEKMNVRQLEKAIESLEKLTDTVMEGYCAVADYSGQPPSYLIFLEVKRGRLPEAAAEILDQCLRGSCMGYKCARQTKEIGMLKMRLLCKGSFQNYEKFLADRGYRMEQNKPLRILLTLEQQNYFRECVEVDG